MTPRLRVFWTWFAILAVVFILANLIWTSHMKETVCGFPFHYAKWNGEDVLWDHLALVGNVVVAVFASVLIAAGMAAHRTTHELESSVKPVKTSTGV